MGVRISEVDRDLVIECDGVVADFTPFRGPSADVGTVYRIKTPRIFSEALNPSDYCAIAR